MIPFIQPILFLNLVMEFFFFYSEGDKPAGHQGGLGPGSRGEQHPFYGHPHQGAGQTEEDPRDR